MKGQKVNLTLIGLSHVLIVMALHDSYMLNIFQLHPPIRPVDLIKVDVVGLKSF